MYIKDDPPGNPLSKAPSPSWFLFIFQCQWNDPPSSLSPPPRECTFLCIFYKNWRSEGEREINIIRIRKKIKIKLRSQKNRRKKTTIKGNHRRRRWEGTWRGETSCIFFGDWRSEWIAKKDLRESRKQKKELLFYYYFFCYYKTWILQKILWWCHQCSTLHRQDLVCTTQVRGVISNATKDASPNAQRGGWGSCGYLETMVFVHPISGA